MVILSSLNYVVVADTLAFNCNTEKHTIIIEDQGKGMYRYRSWNMPKAALDKPDMDLRSKEISVVGTGNCRHTEYSFKTGEVKFIVDDDISCVEGKPPKNAIGNLYVFISDEMKSHYYCLK